MSWCTYKSKDKEHKTAYEDINVYNVYTKMPNGEYFFQNEKTSYKVGEKYEKPLEIKPFEVDGHKCLWISGGFKTYDTDCGVMFENKDGYEEVVVAPCYNNYWMGFHNKGRRTDGKLAIVDCIIPKGSTYYKNFCGFIVSDALVIVGDTPFDQIKPLIKDDGGENDGLRLEIRRMFDFVRVDGYKYVDDDEMLGGYYCRHNKDIFEV